MTTAFPEGKTKVSELVDGLAEALAVLPLLPDEEPMTIDDPRGEGLKTGETGDELAVGGRCCVMASCSKHLTSSAVDKSNGVCPSWFFM
jgi:hypothetical protein